MKLHQYKTLLEFTNTVIENSNITEKLSEINLHLCYNFYYSSEIKENPKSVNIDGITYYTRNTNICCIIWKNYLKELFEAKSKRVEPELTSSLKTNKIKVRDKEIKKNDSKEKEERIPAYKLREFWLYNINPITGMEVPTLSYAHSNNSGMTEYYLDKSKL